ncbi:hypothetical protein PQE66_gp114 [Bacillus phage PBC2]|uniref:Uncharacterized protein n=1 Tax=Bacillus phage PBC2 TaxID=1675029 RepID=A0A218KC03_9CAUD|nr:hypothetical protein PQE66_gp114 [Bacillus phage PBC2]AKQ08429.1 hypothetical protein PBC2_114 [Bacillus phage PBC2]
MIEIGDIVEEKDSGVLGVVTDITDGHYTAEREIWVRWDDTKEIAWIVECEVSLYSKG